MQNLDVREPLLVQLSVTQLQVFQHGLNTGLNLDNLRGERLALWHLALAEIVTSESLGFPIAPQQDRVGVTSSASRVTDAILYPSLQR